jgi:hypothetical protein
MEVLYMVAGAVVLGSIATLVSWLRARRNRWRFRGERMSEAWMKDHVYRVGVTKGEEP